MLVMSDDEAVQKYGVSFQDAETMAPALLSYVLITGFAQQEIAISDTNLRDGLLSHRMRDIWTAARQPKSFARPSVSVEDSILTKNTHDT